MKAQVINTDFLHDGKYYSQNSIINISPDLIKKYPNNLLLVPSAEAVDLFISDEKNNSNPVKVNSADDSNEMNNKIPKEKSAKGGSKKNKRGKKC